MRLLVPLLEFNHEREICPNRPDLGNLGARWSKTLLAPCRGTLGDQNKQRENLVVVNYDDPYKAEEVRLKLRKLQSEHLLDLEDAVVAVKDEKGKVKLRLVTLTGAGAVSGGFCGMLIGLIFLSPLLGFAIGAAAGAASAALIDLGINDHFLKELDATMTSDSSTLFVLVRRATPGRNRILEELEGTGGKILKTSLSHEDEAKLQAALSAAR